MCPAGAEGEAFSFARGQAAWQDWGGNSLSGQANASQCQARWMQAGLQGGATSATSGPGSAPLTTRSKMARGVSPHSSAFRGTPSARFGMCQGEGQTLAGWLVGGCDAGHPAMSSKRRRHSACDRKHTAGQASSWPATWFPHEQVRSEQAGSVPPGPSEARKEAIYTLLIYPTARAS